jgi:flagellar hook-length control protein FliK
MTTTNISHYLSMLGDSANFATANRNNGASGNPAFRSMLMAGFGGQPIEEASDNNNTNTGNVWQVVNGNDDGQNALVLQLSRQGLSPDAIDKLMNAVDHSDLVTIISDPKLNAQLQGMIAGGETGIALNNFAQMAVNHNAETGDITTNVADMNLEEFKEWKKNHFADLASYLSTEKTKIGANGQIIKILQGPAFLSEDGTPSESIVDIIEPQDLNPIEFALQFAQLPQAQNVAIPTQSFTPLPFAALNGVPPQAQAGLQQAMVNNIRGALSGGNGNTGATSTAINAAALGNMGANALANGSTMFTPFMTPADFNVLAFGSDGTQGGEFALPFEAGFKTASHASNPVLTQPSAQHTHPATQMVAVSLTRMASGKGGEAELQQYRLQLDPPEMGRIEVELKFDVGNKVQAMITADKPETLNLLQRDAHALMKALQDAGFDGVGQDNLEFNLSQNQDDAAGRQDRNPNSQNGQNALLSPHGDGEMVDIETQMNVIVDPITGQQRVNMVV